jgi:hypothetical protein
MKDSEEERDLQLLKLIIGVIKEEHDRPSFTLDRITALLTLRRKEKK